tara:strand:- start:893 stop:1555 length:663 start_codon:yes stop_codon:yes gene_type:complete
MIILILSRILIYNQENFKSIDDKYYNLKNNLFSKVFPQGNRNSGGPKWFKFISNMNLSQEDFELYNQFYCGVSGAVVSPSDNNYDIIKLSTVEGKTIYGKYYRCCWPCSCDLMRKDNGSPNVLVDFYNYKNKKYAVLTISDPCKNQNNIPDEAMDFNCGDKSHGIYINGRLTIGMLHDYTYDNKDYKQDDRCLSRNSTPVDEIKGGMGDIFVKLSVVGEN